MSNVNIIGFAEDELEPDQHKQEIIRSYVEEFKTKGCINTIVRMFREVLPEHIYVNLINAIDKEGSILNVVFNAVRMYILLMYMTPPAQPQPPPAPAQGQPPPQQQQNVQDAIVSQVVSKVLERELSGGREDEGGFFDFRSMLRQMIGMALMPMFQQMMMNMMNSMKGAMPMPMPMPMAPQMPMHNVPVQAPQTSEDSKDKKGEGVKRLDIL